MSDCDVDEMANKPSMEDIYNEGYTQGKKELLLEVLDEKSMPKTLINFVNYLERLQKGS